MDVKNGVEKAEAKRRVSRDSSDRKNLRKKTGTEEAGKKSSAGRSGKILSYPKDFSPELIRGERFFHVSGPEPYYVREALRRIEAVIVESTGGIVEKEVFFGDVRGDAVRFIERAGTGNLDLFGKSSTNLFVFRGLEEIDSRARKNMTAFLEQVVLNGESESYFLFEGNLKKGKEEGGLAEFLARHALSFVCYSPYSRDLITWINSLARKKGIILESQAAEAILKRNNNDMLAIERDLEQIALYSDTGGIVDVETVLKVAGASSGFDENEIARDFSRAFLTRNAKLGISIVLGAESAGLPPQRISYVLVELVRLLSNVCSIALKDERMKNFIEQMEDLCRLDGADDYSSSEKKKRYIEKMKELASLLREEGAKGPFVDSVLSASNSISRSMTVLRMVAASEHYPPGEIEKIRNHLSRIEMELRSNAASPYTLLSLFFLEFLKRN